MNDFSKIKDCIISELDLETLKVLDDAATLSKYYLKIALIVTNDAFKDLAIIYKESMSNSTYIAEIFPSFDKAYEWAKTK